MRGGTARGRHGFVVRAVWCVALFGLLLSALGARVRADEPAAAQTFVDVSLHEKAVFRLFRGDGALSIEQRAQRASRALAEVLETTLPDQVGINSTLGRATVIVGATPIVELTVEDAALSGDSTLEVHAARIASRIRSALTRERERSRIANTVFSASLVVFFGLVTLYL